MESEVSFEDLITLPINKKYITNDSGIEYRVLDTSVAEVKDGIISPKKVGKTIVEMADKSGEVIKNIDLEIIDKETNFYNENIELWNSVISVTDVYDDSNDYMKNLKARQDKAVEDILKLESDNKNQRFWTDITDYASSANLTKSYRRFESLAKQVQNPY